MSEITKRMDALLESLQAPEEQPEADAIEVVSAFLEDRGIEIEAETEAEFSEGLAQALEDIPELAEEVDSDEVLSEFIGTALALGGAALLGNHLYKKFGKWNKKRQTKQLKSKEKEWRGRYEREKLRYKIHRYKSRSKDMADRRKQPYESPRQRREKMVAQAIADAAGKKKKSKKTKKGAAASATA